MQVVVRCPKCDAGLPVAASDRPTAIRCGRCGREIALDVSDSLQGDRAVDRCPVCGGGDFYIRKDFDPKLGLTVVVVGALISAVFYWFGQDLVAYSILGGAALIDLAVYGRLKDLTVCYRCHSEFRGAYPRAAAQFDLHTADVLEQEYERKIGRR
jgi:DNA-directed RNA polymerase subunit RPC12/RpoP